MRYGHPRNSCTRQIYSKPVLLGIKTGQDGNNNFDRLVYIISREYDYTKKREVKDKGNTHGVMTRRRNVQNQAMPMS